MGRRLLGATDRTLGSGAWPTLVGQKESVATGRFGGAKISGLLNLRQGRWEDRQLLFRFAPSKEPMLAEQCRVHDAQIRCHADLHAPHQIQHLRPHVYSRSNLT